MYPVIEHWIFLPRGGQIFSSLRQFRTVELNGQHVTANEDFDTNRINQRGMKLIIAVVCMKLLQDLIFIHSRYKSAQIPMLKARLNFDIKFDEKNFFAKKNPL